MVGLDGQSAVSTNGVSPKFGCNRPLGSSHPIAGADLLFGHLPTRRDAGHRLLFGRTEQTQAIPLLLLTSQELVALRGAGSIHHRHGGRSWLACCATRTI